MSNVLDLRRLRYFIAIAEKGSLSAAARSLRIAQPALSHHLRQIESALQVRLLNRHRDGVTLTAAGRDLLGHARAIVERVAVAETSLKAFAASLAEPPRLRLAIISSIAASLTPVLLNEFAQTFPGVQLRITEAATLESRELVDKGTVDVAISLALLGKATPIARERLYLVANALGGQPRGDLTFAALTETPLVLPARENPLRELLEREAARLDRSLNVVLEIDGPSSRTNAISSGRWCTVLGATSAIKLAQTPGFVVRRIVEPELRRPLYLCAREGLPPAFVDRLRLALINALGNLNSLDFAA